MGKFRKQVLAFTLFGLLCTACKKDKNEANSVETWFEGKELTTSNGQSYETGFSQVTSINQDAWVRKKDSNGQILWEQHYERTPVDTRGLLIALDKEENPWVAFSLDGGNTSPEAIHRYHAEDNALDGALFRGFGRAQGAAKILFLARLDPETGRIQRGSFFMSRTSEGNIDASNKTNSMDITRMGFAGEKFLFEARSWYLPPAAGSTQSNFIHHPDADEEAKGGRAYWQLRYTLDKDLRSIEKAEVF